MFTFPGMEEQIRNYNSVLLKGLTPGTEYQFSVRSARSGGYSQAVTTLGTEIDRQTLWITRPFSSVEEGKPLRFTLTRDEFRGSLDVILRTSETGDMLPQEKKVGDTGFQFQQVSFEDGKRTMPVVVETVNDRRGPEPNSHVTVEVMSYPLYPDNPDNEHLYEILPGLSEATGTVTAAVAPTCTLNTGDLWCGVVTVGELPGAYGYNEGRGVGHLSDTDFDVGTHSYTIAVLSVTKQGLQEGSGSGSLTFSINPRPGTAEHAEILGMELHVNNDRFNFSDAVAGTRGYYYWIGSVANLDWSGEDYIIARLREASSPGQAAEPLTAEFQGLPSSHDGETPFTFRIVYSEAVAVTPEAMRTRVLTLEGGAVTGAARVDGESGVWAITVTPDTREALSISLPPAADCAADGAVCTSDGRALLIGAAHIVGGPGPDTGPAPLTATFPESVYASAQHKGPSDRPQVVVAFSAPVAALGADTPSVSATGASVDGVQRLDKEGLEHAYVFFLTPEGHQAIVFRLHANRACTDGGICTADRQQLSNSPSVTVAGPADEPERNTAATGTPTISGTVQVGETLTADTSGIADEDGLDNAAFTYQWLADDADIAGATGSTYTLVSADEGKTVKVRVSFTDGAGNEEELTSGATDAITAAPTPNNPATGAPAISGTAQVGETLTADTSGIADDDGLDNAAFSYQWLADDTEVAGATGSTYTLVEADEGKAIKVRASFADDAGNEETLTSGATDAVAAAPPSNNPATGAPTISGKVQVGETLTADTSGVADEDGLDNVAFTYQWLADNAAIAGATGSTYILADADEGKAIKVRVSFIDDAGNEETLTSAATAAVSAAPPPPPDNVRAVTQKSGAVKLNWEAPDDATVTGYRIERRRADEDRRDNHTLVEDTGSSETGYTDQSAEKGVEYEYRVSARNEDGAGDASDWVSAEPDEEQVASEDVAVWSAIMTVEWVYQGYGYYSTDAKKAGSLSPASFEVDGTTYTVKMVETQGWWMYIGVDRELPFDFVLELDGMRFASNDASFRSYSYGNIYRWEGTGLSLRDGDAVEVRLHRAFEDETAVNSAATGAPIVSGTAQVGETLTADTSGIEDEDGLDDAVFGYQWLADGTDISGATGSTYTLADADEGKTVKVQVTFTDDAGNDETLTSEATDAVAAAPPENNEATGAPSISGTAQVGETLTVDTSGIADEDGLDNADFSYQWLADDTDIPGETGSAYTLADADEGNTVKVRVSFTDDGGNDETLTSGATATVEAAPNNPATGAPTISGTAQVGEKLTADTSGVADEDGLDAVTFSYQWLAGDSDISGATGSAYILTAADDGKAVKVEVSFTDDAGHEETLTSAATDTVAGNEEPVAREDVAAWSATMTVEWVYQGYGYYSTDAKKAGSLSPASFEVDGTTYTVKMVETQGWMYIGVDRELPFDFVLELDGVRFASGDASFRSYSYGNIYKWERTGLRWRDGDTVEVRLLRAFEDETAVNSPATGAPTISGTVQVGETLTADTSDIADADGLDDASFAYQWIANEAEIAGATGLTYTLSVADEGRTVKVQVSFTDDADNGETLTSAATDAVAAATQPNNPATGAPTISGTAQVGETLTADTSGIADVDGLDNVSYSYQWLADNAAIAGATGSTYTLSAADEGKAVKVRVSFTDDAGFGETLISGTTDAVAAASQAISPATGAPDISGTAQVGETLAADTSGIADADGLSGATFSYQWVANDGTSDTDITGATDSTYTLAAADEGKTIKVRVSFTDDAGYGETLTSPATGIVAAALLPLTASLENMPDSHDGQNVFTFELRFSEEFSLSYKMLRDHAFTVAGERWRRLSGSHRAATYAGGSRSGRTATARSPSPCRSPRIATPREPSARETAGCCPTSWC